MLLVGDASLDPKDYLGFGESDFVPTKLIDTDCMETASDDWLADFDGDGLVEMAIGRLPVRNSQEASRVVSKIISYDQSARPDGVLLVADSNDGFNFESASEQLKDLIPGGVSVEEIRRSSLGSAAKSSLLAAVNRGQRIVNYAGHGNVDLWRGDVFSSTDAQSLSNNHGLSLFISMTCLNGYFQDPAVEGMAESLMKAEGRAVAVWASSGMTDPGGRR